MEYSSVNHYEKAFENWLIDNSIKYTAVDDSKRSAFGSSKIKSFDFLLYPAKQNTIIAEVKGRLFKAASFAGLTSLECWVTTDDIEGLVQWQKVFGSNHTIAFVFAYKIENIDVDFDGLNFYDYAAARYVFFTISLDDYRRFMKVRSPRWKTVTLPANKFRECAVQMQKLLL